MKKKYFQSKEKDSMEIKIDLVSYSPGESGGTESLDIYDSVLKSEHVKLIKEHLEKEFLFLLEKKYKPDPKLQVPFIVDEGAVTVAGIREIPDMEEDDAI